LSDVRISDADARVVAALHETGAEGIEGTASALPGSVDGGLASGILGSILARLVSDADDLALANRGTAGVLRAVAADFYGTDQEVGAEFDRMRTDVDPGGDHP